MPVHSSYHQTGFLKSETISLEAEIAPQVFSTVLAACIPSISLYCVKITNFCNKPILADNK